MAHPIIPEGDRVGFPVESHLEIRIFADLVEQEVENVVRFGFWYPNNASSEAYTNFNDR